MSDYPNFSVVPRKVSRRRGADGLLVCEKIRSLRGRAEMPSAPSAGGVETSWREAFRAIPIFTDGAPAPLVCSKGLIYSERRSQSSPWTAESFRQFSGRFRQRLEPFRQLAESLVMAQFEIVLVLVLVLALGSTVLIRLLAKGRQTSRLSGQTGFQPVL